MTDNFNALARGSRFFRAQSAAVVTCSALLVIPCFWHRRIEAGDLPSHTYNAWLAQLIEQGRAPGLYIAHQWTNVLFDFLLLYSAKVFGFTIGPKIAVAVCTLVFFWGVFSFLAAASQREPWLLTPVIAMLAYGYTFNMGFFNYYLSLGLTCFALALLWPPQKNIPAGDWIVGTLFLALGISAHPIGPLWCLATLAYVSVRRRVPVFWRFSVPAAAVAIAGVVHWWLTRVTTFEISWPDRPSYLFNGLDQLDVYGSQYRFVAAALAIFFSVWMAWSFYHRLDRATFRKPFLCLSELYLVSFCVIVLLPQDIRMGLYAAWAGLLVSRLTLVSAIFAVGALNGLKPDKWVLFSGAGCAVIFFILLYRDTGAINQLELHLEQLAASLPSGTRVIPTLEARPDSRIPFVGHVVDRACIGHCFTYSNYEPSSLQFRVRVAPGSPIATASAGDSQEMEAGNYIVQPGDPPLANIHQCSPTDFTIVCARQLAVGDKTGEAVDAEE